MSLEGWWQGVIGDEQRGVGAAVARGLLTTAAVPYWLGLQANLAVYRLGLRRPTQPSLPVISVGNLSLGGTGKSTAVRYLARELQRRGVRPGVVLRGHGRADRTAVVLASDGQEQRAPLSQTGDEAAEVAQALPDVPVAVGKRREAAIALLARAGAQVALLDDGYQYFRMSRVLNIALVSARLDLRAARLFPRGVLREPWAHLRRADQVWITHADQAPAAQLAQVRALVTRHAPGRPLVLACHEAETLRTVEGEAAALSLPAGQAVLAVSGLGCPESFEYTLARLGARVTPLRFADHHRYTPEDWRVIEQQAAASGAAMVVTTQKDAVKLPPDPPLPVWVLHSEMRLQDGGDAVARALDEVSRLVAGTPNEASGSTTP